MQVFPFGFEEVEASTEEGSDQADQIRTDDGLDRNFLESFFNQRVASVALEMSQLCRICVHDQSAQKGENRYRLESWESVPFK